MPRAALFTGGINSLAGAASDLFNAKADKVPGGRGAVEGGGLAHGRASRSALGPRRSCRSPDVHAVRGVGDDQRRPHRASTAIQAAQADRALYMAIGGQKA